MAKQLLSLCATGKLVSRDGYTGVFAKVLLPFYQYGYYFFNGQQYTFPSGTLAQNTRPTLAGTTRPDTFKKDCCHPAPVL